MLGRGRQTSKKCKRCKQHTLHENDNLMGGLIALGFFTCGLLWALVPLAMMVPRNVCQTCGTRRF